jgi:hypothetical protein
MAEAPLPRANSTAARMSAWVTPWPRRPARTKKQGRSHTISSSSRARFLMILFRGAVAATYRDRGPQAHQPTASAACKAKIPMGVELAAAIAPNRRWLPPLSQPAANWVRVTQNAMHQQRRVVLWLSNSLLRSGRSFGSTSRVAMAAPMNRRLPRPGRKPTGKKDRGSSHEVASSKPRLDAQTHYGRESLDDSLAGLTMTGTSPTPDPRTAREGPMHLVLA